MPQELKIAKFTASSSHSPAKKQDTLSKLNALANKFKNAVSKRGIMQKTIDISKRKHGPEGKSRTILPTQSVVVIGRRHNAPLRKSTIVVNDQEAEFVSDLDQPFFVVSSFEHACQYHQIDIPKRGIIMDWKIWAGQMEFVAPTSHRPFKGAFAQQKTIFESYRVAARASELFLIRPGSLVALRLDSLRYCFGRVLAVMGTSVGDVTNKVRYMVLLDEVATDLGQAKTMMNVRGFHVVYCNDIDVMSVSVSGSFVAQDKSSISTSTGDVGTICGLLYRLQNLLSELQNEFSGDFRLWLVVAIESTFASLRPLLNRFSKRLRGSIDTFIMSPLRVGNQMRRISDCKVLLSGDPNTIRFWEIVDWIIDVAAELLERIFASKFRGYLLNCN